MIQNTARATGINRWLIRICAALLAVLAVQYVITLINVPAFYQMALRGEVPTRMLGTEITLSQERLEESAARRGLSLAAYVPYWLALKAILALGFWTAGALVVWRARQEWFRWFTALVLVFYPTGDTWQIAAAVHPVPAAYFEVLALLWPCFPLFLFLFPDGRAVPRWARWPMAGFFMAHLGLQALGFVAGLPGITVNVPPNIEQAFVFILPVFPFVLFCQIYRYWRAADGATRKQIQWLLAALGAILIVTQVLEFAAGRSLGSNDLGYYSDIDYLAGLLIPTAIAIAILRHRLWDIDVIVRRTLIYSVLTGLLALVYVGSVLILQNVLQALTGSGQDQLVAVVSTLGIAALFVPLRSRVQGFIDRRFYRRKYDAAKTVAAFGGAMRDEVEIVQLTNRLIDTVDATVQPAHASLWLRSVVKPDVQ
jgi:hypothetical protein